MKKYDVIESEKSKYYKNVPYITKKQFKEIDNAIIVGKTRLKENKNEENKDINLLSYNNKTYEVKRKILGFKKGYINVGNNEFVILKSYIPFLFLLFFFLLLFFLLFFIFQPKDNIPSEQYKEPIKNVIIDEEDKENDLIADEKPKDDIDDKKTNNNKKPIKNDNFEKEKNIIYTVKFDSNGGYGNMSSITCNEQEKCNLPENIFKKEGYTFVGWSTTTNNDVEFKTDLSFSDIENKLRNNEIILYAIWNINSYKISFLDYDKTLIQESEYNYGDKIEAPQDPIRVGYTFTDWDNSFDLATDNLVIKALYEINTYKIDYNLEGGNIDNEPSNYNVESKDIIIPNPNKIGYTFTGWNINEDIENFIKDYEIPKGTTGDIELTANYKPNSYKLIFNTNGANEEVPSKNIHFNTKFGELPSITKKGYKFVNWTDSNKNEVNGETIFNEPNDITINANWETISYEIKYNLVGGNIDGNPTSYNVESENIVLPNPTKEGYIFSGWSSKDNNVYVKDYEIPKGTTGDIELTANYKPITYYISYNSQGAEGTMENTKVKYNNKLLLSKNSFEKEGYIFKGWSLVPDGEVVYNDEAEIYNLSSEDGAIVNLYAKWQIITLKVQYIDLFGVILKEEFVDYGSNPNYSENPFIEGYTFIGWDSETIEVIKDNTIYKAKYSINNYNIIYDLNREQENDKTTINYNVQSELITLPKPTRTGYTFLGWTGSNGLTPQKDITIPKGSYGDKNYKANWIANTYKITLNPNKGTVEPTVINTTYNSLYGILPTPERTGYTFEGWYSGKDKILDSTIMNKTEGHELIANWELIDYDITYDLKGGNLSSPVSKYNIESEDFSLPIPTKEGYTFSGWTGSNGLTPQKDITIPKGSYGNKNYIANWEVINYSISYNLDGGNADSLITQYNIETPSFSLPIPKKTGYTFTGWTGTGLTSTSKNVTISNETGNRSYTAIWSKNYYTVKYYKDGTLWETRSVGYGDEIPNLTPTGYDDYHKFGGWSGWVNKMPSNDITLTAITSESYCMLFTGTASKANAEGLQVIFTNVGYKSWLYENSQGWGAYTDYSLSRFQVDGLRETFGNSVPWANATPYLNWLSIQCDNGHGEVWKRYSNGNTWTILESW